MRAGRGFCGNPKQAGHEKPAQDYAGNLHVVATRQMAGSANPPRVKHEKPISHGASKAGTYPEKHLPCGGSTNSAKPFTDNKPFVRSENAPTGILRGAD